jgi:hypothetical protein
MGHKRASALTLFLSELLCQFGGLLFAGINHVDRAAIPRMFERKRRERSSPFRSILTNDMVKHAACAAPSSSSGLVPGFSP